MAQEEGSKPDQIRWMITPEIDRDTPRWDPVAWRIVRANELRRELSARVPLAVEAWDGGHPQLRAPLSDPKNVDVVPSAGYSRDFHNKHLRDFTLMASEAVHHVRSALDYIAYQLVLIDGGASQPHTQFPIVNKREKFGQQLGHRLPGISSDHQDLVLSVQPFEGIAWTQHLNDLSNRDKHRFPVDVVPCYAFEHDPNKQYADPLGQNTHIGYQVDKSSISFRFTDSLGTDKTLLEVTETLMSIVFGAQILTNTLFEEFGVDLITGGGHPPG